MKLSSLAFVLLSSVSTLALAQKIDDRTIQVQNENRDMARAIAQAQASLDDFLRLHAAPPKGADGFKLKVKITDDNGSEHMWVIPFKQTKTGFEGTLANNPDVVDSVSGGDTITFKRADISDWGYVVNGKQKGSFTVCVLFKQMPAAEVKRFRQDHGFECY